MIARLSVLFLAASVLTSASPTVVRRAVQQLDQAAFEEAQQRDDTATRAFSDTAIKVCIQIDLSCHVLTNSFCRLLMESASQLISCQETSVQISPRFRLPPAIVLTVKNGTSSPAENTISRPEPCWLSTL